MLESYVGFATCKAILIYSVRHILARCRNKTMYVLYNIFYLTLTVCYTKHFMKVYF